MHKLTGYDYQVNDHEPYFCLPSVLVEPPVLEPEPPILEPEPPLTEASILELEVPTAFDAPTGPVDSTKGGLGRPKRSYYFGPTNEKNDVYGIFKVRLGLKNSSKLSSQPFFVCSRGKTDD